MQHDTALIATVVAGLGVAFVFGLLAARLRFPPIVGYLVAGVVVSPFTPGYVVNSGIAGQLAELGVVLLMFGVGLHFSIRDILSVRRIVVPAALLQTTATTALGGWIGHAWGWGWGGGISLGLCLGVASTVVLLKGLEGRDRLDSPEGRLAVGWLVIEDIMMVFALVLLPALAPVLGGNAPAEASPRSLPMAVGVAMAQVVAFAALMMFVGRRFVPWLLEHVARTGSRELFTLSVLTTALGIGTLASEGFGVSFALGAFFAGAVMSESDLSARAAAQALPMQDAFAVLFFVSVGMLFDPQALVEDWPRILALVAVVVVWKSVVSFALLRLLGHPRRSSLIIGSAFGQIGEFSFIVAGLAVSLGLAPRELQAMIVVAAIAAITINAPVLSWIARLTQQFVDRDAAHQAEVSASAVVAHDNQAFDFSALVDHVVLVGHGRVGGTVADALIQSGAQHVVIEEQERVVAGLRRRGEQAIQGDATRPDVLERAGIRGARLVVITAPEPFRARRILDVARAANPLVAVAVRTHSAAEQAFFEEHLATPNAVGRAVYAEREAALSLAHFALLTIGRSDDEADAVVAVLRGHATAPTETFKSLATREFRTLSHNPPS